MNPRPESTDYKTARLVEVTKETHDTSTYLFLMEPGASIHFAPGQFNMIGFPGFEEAPISMSSLPYPDTSLFAHTIRRVGRVTERIGRLEPGQSIMVRGPFGRGWPMEEFRGRNVVVVAGGIGLAPLRPLLLRYLEHPDEINQLTLVYGAKIPGDLLFKRELFYWQDKSPMSTIYCVDRMENGEVSGLKLREGLVTVASEELDRDPKHTVACLCGPEIMMRFVARALLRVGYASRNIHVSLERRMRCGSAHCGHCQIGSKFVCKDGPVFSYSDISRFADTLL